ncbi:MAG: hypothetical protein JGK03_15510 [Microcoleus sp. PH2017_25_DOB_D_A]|jgi:hypothetical protein|uniref:hypothetical protein n=1 Tax=unclassified Microcoleus TaxID=2642155 RepID=UPI001E06B7FC|nr:MULTISPECIES: hypothetical protein [unclassified Microcoleus]MCC3498347.1 hypothetical protein [Microcoleus sp. PH2017_15_JOR_U_A]MCC3509530.1 hypothetical protein [Microcoleus sp. PH2017_17_BER_D_A]MCC3535580.1 hypothetical protein [Microcoleus sp. PH2017_25_DOB_D_A]MCC3545451.1 hypothetical protein [Microcoleus sp. PH2017_24_DOB_U_A]
MLNWLTDWFIHKVVDGQRYQMLDIDGVYELKIISYRSGQHYGNVYQNGELINCIQGENRQQIIDKAQIIADAQVAEAARAVVRYAAQNSAVD